MDYTQLVQYRVKCQAFLNTVMNLWVLWNIKKERKWCCCHMDICQAETIMLYPSFHLSLHRSTIILLVTITVTHTFFFLFRI